jgi:hypothetical protein
MSSLAVLFALAHPGHGETAPSSWRHYLTEPVHLTALLVASLAVAIVVGLWWQRAYAERDGR